jgi:D-glycero-alpha-D-manno-heptose-7-phosphate kinase
VPARLLDDLDHFEWDLPTVKVDYALSGHVPWRAAAARGAGALAAGDLDAYGAALSANTVAQAALHASLVSAEAQTVLDVARASGASGGKVNGAGGDGGSLTLLAGPAPSAREQLAAAVAGAVPTASVRPVRLDDQGVQVRVSRRPARG